MTALVRSETIPPKHFGCLERLLKPSELPIRYWRGDRPESAHSDTRYVKVGDDLRPSRDIRHRSYTGIEARCIIPGWRNKMIGKNAKACGAIAPLVENFSSP